MKQNLIIVLLTAVVVLLAVDVFQGKYPPSALATSGGSEWTTCSPPCMAINTAGEVFLLQASSVKFIEKAKR